MHAIETTSFHKRSSIYKYARWRSL